MIKTVNCIECPKGCEITVETENGEIKSINGYTCQRGKTYAENEIICPRRVLTTTVKTVGGKVVSVKTDKPVKKSEIFDIMKKINDITLDRSVKIGDKIVENVSEDINLVATNNIEIK
ncbi:MAG: DUF1667 domain-containing protein [Clostridia bacterium]|nr:DUF1667 domain-containing protein [Clostridia bacterium]